MGAQTTISARVMEEIWSRHDELMRVTGKFEGLCFEIKHQMTTTNNAVSELQKAQQVHGTDLAKLSARPDMVGGRYHGRSPRQSNAARIWHLQRLAHSNGAGATGECALVYRLALLLGHIDSPLASAAVATQVIDAVVGYGSIFPIVSWLRTAPSGQPDQPAPLNRSCSAFDVWSCN